jgi:hypothetical protein
MNHFQLESKNNPRNPICVGCGRQNANMWVDVKIGDDGRVIHPGYPWHEMCLLVQQTRENAPWRRTKTA